MPNFTELLFASVLLISTTVTMSGCASLDVTSSSPSSLPQRPTLPTPQPQPQLPENFNSLDDEHNSIELLSKICHSNSDCPSTHCCTVGMMRYSQPTCLLYGQLGDSCIPGNGVQNFTLSYPRGGEVGGEEEVTVIDSFRLLCPCATELQCDEKSVSCMTA